MGSDDERLVRRCLAGDTAAFDRLYDRHAARVYHLLRRLTGNEADAEDLAQETFLAAYRSLASWRGEAALGTWLCGIACRLYANSRRRCVPEEAAPFDDDAEFPAPDDDPLAHCLRHETARCIETAILALPPLFREAFVLVKVEGLSYRQAGDWLGVPLGTLQWRLWRAVRLLQRALADLVSPDDTAAPDPAPRHSGSRTQSACPAPPGSRRG